MKFCLKFTLAMLCPILLNANLCTPNSLNLEELIDLSEFIIEGEIVKQHSFWDANGANILTAHDIKVAQSTSTLKQAVVTVHTIGGCVNDDCVVFSNQPTFQKGDYGIFFASKASENMSAKSGAYALTLTAGQLNFINLRSETTEFNIKNESHSAKAIFEKVEKQTGKTFAYQEKLKDELAYKKAASVTSISPLNIPADGTRVLSIRGNGFGSLTDNAKIYMLNPNFSSGKSYVAIPKSFITKWNNTLIQIKVPSFDIRTNFPGVASGPVKIISSSGAEVTSTQKVNVTYNQKKLDDQPIDLISHSNNGEIPFYVSNALKNDGALPAINRAFELWYCQTGIKFKIAGYVNTKCYTNDNKNVISYDDECSITQLGFTRLAISMCSSKNDAYLRDLDIIINRDKKWSFDLEKDSDGTSDFASTILHEMGHAHLLGHVLNKDDILYPIIVSGENKKELNQANQNGGEAILLESKKQNVCTSYKPVSVFNEGSCCTPVQDDKINYVSEALAIISFLKEDESSLISVRYRKAGQSQWNVVSTSKNYALLNKLEACANYQVQVSDACGTENNNKYTKPIINLQTKGCDSCGTPEIVSASMVNQNSVAVKWDIVPYKDIYEIQYRVGYGNPWTLYKSAINRFTRNNLEQCSVFQYRLRTYCDDEISKYTPIQTIQTFCENGNRLNDETNEVEFMLAPNPVKNQMLIIPQQVDFTNSSYSIKDISGRAIQAEAMLPNNYLINTSKFNTGIYFIEIVKNERRYIQRFVKE